MSANPKHIVLITSGQPALNPRLIKEADALSSAGYQVTVLYQFWTAWAEAFDAGLLVGKPWRSKCIGGSPDRRQWLYFITRIRHKAARFLAHWLGFRYGIAAAAIGRCGNLLFKAAIELPADLYIAHNLAALPAAVMAAQMRGVKCGFDAEDFHRNEVSNDPLNFDVRIKTWIEGQYFKQIDCFTVSSPLIAQKYETLFPALKASVIRNVFPKTSQPPSREVVESQVLKLFWFSQTLNENRGLEEIVVALAQVSNPLQLHLMGNCPEQYHEQLLSYARHCGMRAEQIFFHGPVAPEGLHAAAGSFDIGIAAETGQPFNRDICLTNKLFTYIQSGLLVLASNTRAQELFYHQNPGIGELYELSRPESLAACVSKCQADLVRLNAVKYSNYQLGQSVLNWENEQRILLDIIRQTIGKA